jgi:hypothetical protein
MTNPMQPLDPSSPPDQVTPQVASAYPPGYAGVTPHGQGPAPYDIQAPMSDGEIGAAFDSANAIAGAGVIYPMGPRQAQTQQLLESPQGFSAGGGTSGYDIIAGFHGDGGDGWPADVQPGILETPDQGQMGTYPQSSTT